METKVAARWARRSAVVLFVAGVCATFGVAGASALPGIGRAARLPVRGPSVSLGCASPLAGQVQCFGRAIRPAKQDGPEIMAGPTGPRPDADPVGLQAGGSQCVRADGRDRRRLRRPQRSV